MAVDFDDVATGVERLIQDALDNVRDTLKTDLYDELENVLTGVDGAEDVADEEGYEVPEDDADEADIRTGNAERDAFVAG